jgi:hypothetical protein
VAAGVVLAPSVLYGRGVCLFGRRQARAFDRYLHLCGKRERMSRRPQKVGRTGRCMVGRKAAGGAGDGRGRVQLSCEEKGQVRSMDAVLRT